MRDEELIAIEKKERTEPKWYNPRFYHLKQLKKTTNHIISDYVAISDKGILIDFGCGSMPYKDLFQPFTKQYIGADIADNKAAELLIQDGKIEINPEFADIILSTQVLEHVINPAEYLEEANRVLKKNGLILLSTHGVWRYHPDPTDFWRWTSDGLKKIIDDAGFEVIEIKGVMGLASTGLQLFQDAFIFKLPKLLLYPFVMIMQALIALFDLIHSDAQRKKDACVFFIVAKKR